MTATKKKPERRLSFNRDVGAVFMTITTGKKVEEFGYWLDNLPSDFGPSIRCYRMTKFVANQKPGEPDHYDVQLQPAAGAGECECWGHARWSPKGTICKHIAALLALHAEGRLSS